jgi:ankyrin repeat protein
MIYIVPVLALILGPAHHKKPMPEAMAEDLMFAATGGDLKTVQKIVRSGYDVNTICRFKIPALSMAVLEPHHMPIIRLLVEAGASVNEPDNSKGMRPLGYAAHRGRLEVTRYLVAHGADVNGVNQFGHTPLRIAAVDGYADEVRLLLELGADKNIPDKNGHTPLQALRAFGYRWDWLGPEWRDRLQQSDLLLDPTKPTPPSPPGTIKIRH